MKYKLILLLLFLLVISPPYAQEEEKGEIKKISVGIFASNQYSGPTNFTLKSK